MKKLFLTLFFAVLGVAAMAQTLSIKHDVKDKYGENSMLVTVNYAVEGNGNANLYAYVCDLNGRNVKANINGYSDGQGYLCALVPNMSHYSSRYTATFYIPYRVLCQACQPGKWGVWFYMEDADSYEEIMRTNFYTFSFYCN